MFVEDISQFFEADDFAVTVTRADATTFSAIFDDNYQDPFSVAGSAPRLMFSSSLGLSRDESLTIAGVSFKVRTLEPDGTGVSVARLENQ